MVSLLVFGTITIDLSHTIETVVAAGVLLINVYLQSPDLYTIADLFTAGCIAAPDPGIFERGGSPLAVIYTVLLIFSFLIKLYEIIEPRLLEKRGFQPPEPPLDPALY